MEITITLSKVQEQDREDFIDVACNYSDFFGSHYIGYWGYGVSVKFPDQSAWLVYEQVDDYPPSDLECAYARACALAHDALPKGWHLLNRQLAGKVWDTMALTKPMGEDGIDYDGDDVDNAMQHVLLGEQRYG